MLLTTENFKEEIFYKLLQDWPIPGLELPTSVLSYWDRAGEDSGQHVPKLLIIIRKILSRAQK